MKYFQENIEIGGLPLRNNIFYAPLAGCSDYPFRKMASSPLLSVSPGLFFCEMVKIDALVRHEPSTYRLLDYDSSMHPIGAQICGAKLGYVKEACSIIEDLGFDLIDLNCGCPVRNVAERCGGGAGLLKHPEKIGDMLHEMRSSTTLPVTLKIRTGWDEHSINAPKITEIAEKAGASLITIHGRTRKQAYKGKASFFSIREAKKRAKKIKVFANGDIFDPISAETMWQETKADGILVARGTMGQPWIAEDIATFFREGHYVPRNALEIKEFFLEHFEEIARYQTGKKALLDMRRVGNWFLRQLPPETKILQKVILQEKSPTAILHSLRSFPWDSLLRMQEPAKVLSVSKDT